MSTGVYILLNVPSIDAINSYGLKFDEFCIASLLYFKRGDLLDVYMKGKTDDQRHVTMQPLVRKQLMGYSVEATGMTYTLSREGMRVMSGIFGSMSMPKESPPPVIVMGEPPAKTDLDSFTTQFLELFPKGVKNGGNVLLRSSPVDVKNKLYKFMEKYKYDRETIILATENYIRRFRNTYTYCQAAMYFIMKDNSSALATECELVVSGGTAENIINPFEDKM